MFRMKLYVFTFLVLMVIAIGLAGMLLYSKSTSVAGAGIGGNVSVPPIQRTVSAQTGGSGISPHLNSVPAFTEDDVRQFVKQNTTQIGLKIDVTGPISITNINFLTAQEVRQRIHSSGPNVPDNTLLCYVELTGSFSVSVPGQVGSFSSAYEIFDASTGNYLVGWVHR